MTVLKTSINIAAKNLARDDQPRNSGENCGRFDLVPNTCGAQAPEYVKVPVSQKHPTEALVALEAFNLTWQSEAVFGR